MINKLKPTNDANQNDLEFLRSLILMQHASNYDLSIPDERERSNQDLEFLFFSIVNIIKPDMFIEAGAKDAYASQRVAEEHVNNCKIFAFEANPYNIAKYKDSNEKAGVDYRHLALNDKEGKIKFKIKKDKEGKSVADGRSSLLKKNDHEHGYEEFEVISRTLDNIYDEESELGEDSIGMWVDVEGATGVVLSGAKNMLKKCKIMLVEVEDHEYWEGQFLSYQVESLLTNLGLKLIARDFQYNFQYNQVYVSEDVLEDHTIKRLLSMYYSRCGKKMGR